MTKELVIGRRTVLKKGSALCAALGGAGAVVGSAAAQDWEYKLVVEADGGSGKYTADWEDLDIVATENIEQNDWVGDNNVSLWVDDQWKPVKDIVKFNAADIYPTDETVTRASNLDVTVSGDGQTVDLV
ncbi:hypothetical protein [Haloarcula salina]|uniref:Uncharacterized protein n=1 Tax=Haloarcula salina TaxID=1429914 RepID=A0AA41FZC3_9EURY|nr:hypothetical protein [Haloarcula salina]MBV0900689.1 hypothetical protein [Haloarcula salina]